MAPAVIAYRFAEDLAGMRTAVAGAGSGIGVFLASEGPVS